MSNTAEAAPGDANQATRDAYALNARVRTIVVETLPTIARQCREIDFASRSTGSDSMPGNVALAIDDMLSTLEAMKARVDGDLAHQNTTAGAAGDQGAAAMRDEETWVEKKTSYCEVCDTAKKNVRWWTEPFATTQTNKLYSACKPCVRAIPKAHASMPLSW